MSLLCSCLCAKSQNATFLPARSLSCLGIALPFLRGQLPVPCSARCSRRSASAEESDAPPFTPRGILAAFLAVTLPFYLHDPSASDLRHSLTKLHEAFPLARALVFTSTAACHVPASRRNDSFFPLFRNSALVQALFFEWAGRSSHSNGPIFLHVRFTKEGYGIQFLFFGALAWWIRYGHLQLGEGARRG